MEIFQDCQLLKQTRRLLVFVVCHTAVPTRLSFLEADRVQELRQRSLIRAGGQKSCCSQGSWRARLKIGIGEYRYARAGRGGYKSSWTRPKGRK